MPQRYCECGHPIYGTTKHCSKCYRIRRQETEMMNRSDADLGKPNQIFLIPFDKIHYLCQCSWVYDLPSQMHRLKYFNMQCLVMVSWHKQTGILPRMYSQNGRA